MHSVFEPAAFAYLNELRKVDSILETWPGLGKVCLEILRDETSHMNVGLKLSAVEIEMLPSEEKNRLQKSFERHRDILLEVPKLTIGDSAFARSIESSFAKNSADCFKRLLR